MTERLLQFIWQFQYFNKTQLLTDTGETIGIIFAGQYNLNQGPDFSNAKIKIGQTVWAGTVELHIKTSDWLKHHHEQDGNYHNVILHVVWEHDKEVNNIPVLELNERVAGILLQRYEELMQSVSFIPCEKMIASVQEITWKSWKDRLLVERLLRKSAYVNDCLQQNNYHWEQTFWWLLARNLGMKVNADAFEAMARSTDLSILSKHKHQPLQVEALLLGQAGLLNNDFEEDYPNMLQQEYRFLQRKYALKTIHQPIHFLRMCPGNFPTLRLAQLAALVTNSTHLFSTIKESTALNDIHQLFDCTANDYWHYHYRLDEQTNFKKKKLGKDMIDSIIINTVVPVLFAYGHYYNEIKYKDKALQWLEETAAEANSITKGFQQLSVENKTAFDSQALIELKLSYCDKKMCLNCGLGNSILKA